MDRPDGVLAVQASSAKELAEMLTQVKKEYAVTHTQTHPPNPAITVWTAFVYYARKFE